MRSKLVIAALILSAALGLAAHLQAAEDKATFSKCMNMAEQIALPMTPGREKDIALGQIIFTYSRAGVFEPIIAIDNEILNHHAQIQALLSAFSYSDAPTEDEKASGAMLLRRALALVPTDPEAWSRDNLLWQLAGSFAEIGQIDAARDAIKLIESLGDYDHALYQIAAAQAHQHDLAGAAATAESMRPGSLREQAFAVIVEFATHYGDAIRADDAFAQTRRHSDSALHAMAWEKSEAHDFRAALELARQIVNSGVHDGAMQKVGEDAAAAGALDFARDAFREAQAYASQREESFALANIASAQAKATLFDDAMVTVGDLEKLPIEHRRVMNGNDLVFALGNIAKEQGRKGRRADARRTLDRARPNLLGGADSASIASDAVAIGEIAWAREVANGLRGLARFRALQWIAAGLAKREDFDGAAATVADIEQLQNRDDDFADSAREDIAVVQILHDRVVDAFETISRIQHPMTKVFALTRMAAAAVGKCISASMAFCE
jgi:hypothetical protein